jgi:SAM-dependent methyltransferase
LEPRARLGPGRPRSAVDSAALQPALDGSEEDQALVAALIGAQRTSARAFPRCVLILLAPDAEAGSLARTLARIPAGLAPLLAEIAVLAEGVDGDPPPAVAALGLSNLRWRANPRRYGHGGRRKVALEYALQHGFDQVVLVEGHDRPLDQLARLWAPAVLEGADVVLGAAARAGLGPALAASALNGILGMRLKGWGADLRLYSCELLAGLPFQLASDDRRFDTEVLIQCRARGARIREVALPAAGERAGSLSAALAYRLHQMHVSRNGAFLIRGDVRYTFKHSPYGSHVQTLAAIRPGTSVLDLGCSQGLLAGPLKHKGVRVVGVDLEPPERASRDLEAYHRRDLEQPLAIPAGREFDYVVVSDVIEHVVNRGQLLRSARRYLKPDGRLLISTPNIAIWFYRLSRLAGRFEYGPRGVLDETHVHLYTRSTFRREVERGGFRILRERVTALPFEVIFESTGQSRLVAALSFVYHGLARAWPKLFAYQFLIEAELTTLLDPAQPAEGR